MPKASGFWETTPGTFGPEDWMVAQWYPPGGTSLSSCPPPHIPVSTPPLGQGVSDAVPTSAHHFILGCLNGARGPEEGQGPLCSHTPGAGHPANWGGGLPDQAKSCSKLKGQWAAIPMQGVLRSSLHPMLLLKGGPGEVRQPTPSWKTCSLRLTNCCWPTVPAGSAVEFGTTLSQVGRAVAAPI